MIHSMTGYGKAEALLPSKIITVEIKSLNSKNLDLNSRVPSAYRDREMEIRNLLAASLLRGKVDFNLYVEVTGEAATAQLNDAVVKNYIDQLAQIVDGDPVELLKMAVRLPDVLKNEPMEIGEAEYALIFKAVGEALEAVLAYRADEGKALESEFMNRSQKIAQLLEKVIDLDPQRIAGIKERLRKAVEEIKGSLDENRFEQELIYYLEKYDITEEKVRLKNHLGYFEETLRSTDSNGKKLGFISQEMGREINTIGSKANFAPMQQLVVQMKDELEKIKEQSLNIL